MKTAFRWLWDQPILLLTLTMLFWAGNVIAGQVAAGQIGPLTLVLMRWLLVAPAMWLLFGREVREHWADVRHRLPWIAAMAFLGFTGFNALYYLGSQWTVGVNVGILQGSLPAFVLIGAFLWRGTRIGWLQVAGIAMTLTGVVLVATRGDPAAAIAIGFNIGDLVLILACGLYAVYTVLLPDRPAIPGKAFFALMAPIAALTSLPLALAEIAVAADPVPTLKGLAVVVFVAIFPSCLAQLFFLRGVDLMGPGRAGMFVNLVPVFAALLSVGLLGEDFRLYHALALGLVIGGIAIAERR